MRMKLIYSSCLLTAVLVAGAQAQRLDPVFRAMDVTGKCSIQLPGESDFKPVRDGQAYPYNSRIRTEGDSSVSLNMAEGSTIRVMAASDLELGEDALDNQKKVITLHEGEMEAELAKAFHESGNQLSVETTTAITTATGTRFRVAERSEQDLRITIIRVLEGMVKVYGEHFNIEDMTADNWLSLLSPADKSYLRLKNMQGEFNILIQDEDHTEKEIPTQEGTVLNIWQRQVPETQQIIVTAVLSGPDGQMIETTTVVYGPEDDQEDDEGIAPPVDPGQETDPGDQDDGQRRNPQPPDSDVDENTPDRDPEDENIEQQRRTAPPTPPAPGPPTPTPPAPGPTPTPVGRR